MKSLALRLTPGQDLRLSLEVQKNRQRIEAGCILSCVGSLSEARLRLAGRSESLVIAGPLHILSLSGTLAVDGVHLHLTVADRDGAVTGGHLLEGCIIHTTAEIVLGVLEQYRFTRPPDQTTGYRELRVDPKRDDAADVG